MNGFAPRPLALLIACLFVGSPMVVMAADAEADMAAAADPVPGLRAERKFNVQAKKRNGKRLPFGADYSVAPKENEDFPLFIVADHLDGRAGDLTEAEGKVELRKAGTLLFADHALYRPATDEVDATGNVVLMQDGGEIRTPHLRMRLSEQIGVAEDADYRLAISVSNRFYAGQEMFASASTSSSSTSSMPMMINVPNNYGLPTKLKEPRVVEGSGHADRIDFTGENQMMLTQATYSTCKPDDPDWYVKANELSLDLDSSDGTAQNASIWFKGMPILYSPVASFPLGSQRRSGILNPFFSTSSKNGLDITAPLYWNVAPNYDLTLYPRYLSKRGTQLGGDARYLDYNFQGFARFEYMPNDEVLDRQRFAYRFEHRHDLGEGLSASIKLNGVSDNTYWQDMSSRLLQTSQTQLPKQAMLSYAPSSWLQTSLQVLHYQTLQPDPTTVIAKPYFLEPQLNVIGYRPDVLAGMDFNLVAQMTRFTHQDASKVYGDRFVMYPQLSLPIVEPGYQITPKIGLHFTSYNLQNQTLGQPTSFNRALPTFSLDTKLVFERETEWLGKGAIQTLEPRLYYVRIPYRDQSNFPVFDSGLTDFNFSQIFSENRYAGFDRINDANQMTAALVTRMLDAETGIERFKAMFGQRYYFSPQRVTIPGETTRQADFSNLVTAVNGLILPKTYADMAWEYNYNDGRTERFAAGARYQPEFGKVFSASYRYTRNPLSATPTVDQIDLAGQWPLGGGYYGVGRYNYSLRDGKILEAIGGVEYISGCWAARVVAQRLGALSGSPNTTLFFQLEFNDFGDVGSNPIGQLRRSVPGYGKINELFGTENSQLITQ